MKLFLDFREHAGRECRVSTRKWYIYQETIANDMIYRTFVTCLRSIKNIYI